MGFYVILWESRDGLGIRFIKFTSDYLIVENLE